MISVNWLKDYIDLDDININDLRDKVTLSGINVEKVITSSLNNLVVGQILECSEIPDTHLHKCLVDVETDKRQIVCGASNVRKGLKVIVALPGAELPGGITIKKSVIKGEESCGMICALSEIGLEEDSEENYQKGIHELPSDTEVGLDITKCFGLDDILLELDLNPNRSGDCTNQIGFAYEVGSVLGRKVKLPEMSYKEEKESVKDNLSVEVDTDKCPLYLAKMVRNIKVKESPEFIINRLLSAGMRPINNVVDISNYVMLEFGQPLHFFDYNKLNKKILVRDSYNDEKIVTLDNKERILKEEDIVITDGKDPICIAGIMGGKNSEVDDDTVDIVIESAIFDAVSIRYTSNNLDLKSEASVRYERGLNFENTYNAINRACHLLEKYANGKVLSDTIIHDKIDKTIKEVTFNYSDIKNILGIEIPLEEVKKILNNLDFKYEINKEQIHVEIPFRRIDIMPHKQDIIEEIGRLFGYDNIPPILPVAALKEGSYSKSLNFKKILSKKMRALGFNQVQTYTLVEEEDKLFNYDEKESIYLLKPLSSDKKVIRQTLIPSLLKVYEYNKARKVDNIFIYEIAKVYYNKEEEETKLSFLMSGKSINGIWNNVCVESDFYLMKGYLENILNYLGFKNRYSVVESKVLGLHPYISCDILLDREKIGIMGKVHPKNIKDDVYVLEMSLSKLMSKDIKPLKYKELSKYPSIVKDVAFLLDKNILNKDIEDKIRKYGGRLLTDISVFDLYEGERIDSNRKSIAYSLTFSDQSRTLSDDEIMEIFNKIIEGIKKEFNAEVRDK